MFFRNSKIIAQITKIFAKNYSKTSKQENLALVLRGIGDLCLEPRPMPKPKSHQVLLQMESIGICGSDVHYYVEGKIGPFIVDKPMVIGHEASGTVIETGKNVKHLQPGDRVAIEPGVGCRICNFCKEGKYNLCPDMKFCATPPIDGNLSRFYVHDADFCFKIPGMMTFDEAALMEPLSVAVHCCKRGNVRFGDKVLVMGAGPIGLANLYAAKTMGASSVLITDLKEYRLKKAEEIGADFVYKIQKNSSDEAIVNDIKEFLGEEPNVTIDSSGAEQCIRISLQVTKSGGVVILAGMSKFEMNLPISDLVFREVDVRGIFRYCNDYPTAIKMVGHGRSLLRRMITHHYKMEDAVEAFERAKSGEGDPIKIIIHANPDWEPCGGNKKK